MKDENIEERLKRVEEEVDDIRDAVAQNAKNISKLYSSVMSLESKVNILVEQISRNNDIIMTTFNQYKSIIDNLIKMQKNESIRKMKVLDKVIDYLAKVALIALGAALGLKAIGLV